MTPIHFTPLSERENTIVAGAGECAAVIREQCCNLDFYHLWLKSREVWASFSHAALGFVSASSVLLSLTHTASHWVCRPILNWNILIEKHHNMYSIRHWNLVICIFGEWWCKELECLLWNSMHAVLTLNSCQRRVPLGSGPVISYSSLFF